MAHVRVCACIRRVNSRVFRPAGPAPISITLARLCVIPFPCDNRLASALRRRRVLRKTPGRIQLSDCITPLTGNGGTCTLDRTARKRAHLREYDSGGNCANTHTHMCFMSLGNACVRTRLGSARLGPKSICSMPVVSHTEYNGLYKTTTATQTNE